MELNEYIKLFIDKYYPEYLNKYLNTKTMKRLLDVSQFCGCDYTSLYNPRFFYTRFYHSLVVALINYHFTHDKKSTIASLLHDNKTPCFAHTIDYVLGDYKNQESSENIAKNIFLQDKELLKFLKEDKIDIDEIDIDEIEDLSHYPILENKSPRLCADRLDGVLHTCYIWLQTHSLEDIYEVYQNLVVLDKGGILELGFKSEEIALKFVKMVLVYAKELQCNRNKFATQYLCDAIKILIRKRLISFDDLYTKKEEEIIKKLEQLPSWNYFKNATNIWGSEEKIEDVYAVSIEVKKRNVIPLVSVDGSIKRIDEINDEAKKIYQEIEDYQDSKYAYVRGLKLN